jgi:hypothetical protein
MIEFPKESVFRIEDGAAINDHGSTGYGSQTYLDARRREALEYLGERWVLHPQNRITRLEKPYKPILWREAA